MQNHTTRYSKWLALVLFIVNWLRSDVESPASRLGETIGQTIAPFIFSALIMGLLRLFGVAWRAKIFFFIALALATMGIVGFWLKS